ncbi:nucleoside 2-deoxyribosyltransferase [Roseomonas sp. GC11]|uniref:nucleoside 2-deoxyribosyltransferase n=1 Tax=Roseomonas sp. GC11 TaxID=2950546 RepID=UPI00210C0725|nr:nucleoside 2-deoxyribosyltransferase [Roseomonas sp. GC11]MCQ4160038.1 nucleoside 2-deoxyribosyltransferase [Roseomonas sp. GC11]
MLRAYLAGPDVFLPDAPAHAARKRALCARHGIEALAPLNEDVASLAGMDPAEAWQTIYRKDVAMMEAADIAIANLTPFRGVSADSGTLVELGWFLGRGKPVIGYSNDATPFAARCHAFTARCPDPLPGISVEGFGLADNLMILGALAETGGHPMLLPADGVSLPFDSLALFEAAVALAARR